jgi:hypothetical protein
MHIECWYSTAERARAVGDDAALDGTGQSTTVAHTAVWCGEIPWCGLMYRGNTVL